jgi:3-phosphoshikimate 1-carboxyvinyltransferase
MTYSISHPTKKLVGTITLTASKSESNRVLMIQAMTAEKISIENLATAQDTVLLEEALKTINAQQFDLGAGGTTMRFLTAYLATQQGVRILTGSARMKKRPIGILVDALRQFGADIAYLEEEGFPPLKITGKALKGGEVEMDGNVSSQFISALLLISPLLQNGLAIKLKGEVTSRPYINMTLKIMEEFMVFGQWHDDYISVSKQEYQLKDDTNEAYKIESDWSAASYWYSMVALANEADLTIKGLKHPSLQGDAMIADIYTFFGVKTEYLIDGIRLTKQRVKDEHFGFDFSDCPDVAQTIAVTVSALGIPAFFNGIHTLRIKETDRMEALKTELKKLDVEVAILNDNSLKIVASKMDIEKAVTIATYDDHRMAMAFAAMAIKLDSITIQHPEVVRKSYPDFWNDLQSLGFVIKEVE